jgi:uncharacterized protein (TIGR00255 family)
MSAPLASMTGFSRSEGSVGSLSWIWELRSVNGRGLDLRLRLPAGFDQLEPAIRELASRTLRRGNVSATLTIKREEAARLTADPAALEQVLHLALSLAQRIPGCPPPRAESLLSLPGVLRPTHLADQEAPDDVQLAAIRAGFEDALERLQDARRAEGARLGTLLHGLLGEIATQRAQAQDEAADQPAFQRSRMLETVQALLRETPGLPEERIAQEVALLAARSDVREELDRLDSHIAAAHTLLLEGANIGRRFDFLVQEFVRETNTLCSKSASTTLTATGLRLKATIEQLREQVQNIE